MANWLTKTLSRPPQAQAGRNVPANVKKNPLSIPAAGAKLVEGIPNASIIYGVAASALFVIALFFVFAGKWVTAALVLLPAFCFLGYALHFIKHPH